MILIFRGLHKGSATVCKTVGGGSSPSPWVFKDGNSLVGRAVAF
jgi:hypothetical protein